jgi:hypothetical protein
MPAIVPHLRYHAIDRITQPYDGIRVTLERSRQAFRLMWCIRRIELDSLYRTKGQHGIHEIRARVQPRKLLDLPYQ